MIAPSVTLDIRFRLTNADQVPMADVPVRVVFATEIGWQQPDAGRKFVTDGRGAHRFTTTVSLETRLRKRSTNFVTSLLSRRQPTDYLRIGTELEYATHSWLYTIDLYHFPDDGTVVRDNVTFYARDERGRFTREAERESGAWKIAGLGGLMLTSAGHEVSSALLRPDPTELVGGRWTLDLAYMRLPEPVNRQGTA